MFFAKNYCAIALFKAEYQDCFNKKIQKGDIL
jgi:hypothetical protein